jgi:HSP20 family molecular chaperone IbpA
MKTLITLFILISSVVFAQTNQDDQFARQIEEVMKAREEMLKMLMDDSNGANLEKRMMDMMKQFNQHGLDNVFDQSPGTVVGEYDWVESDKYKTLKLKVTQVKDHPLDIKIEKGMIKFKGNVESVSGQGKNKTKQRISFERSFSLPDDVDQTNPEFENKGGELLIKFKKLIPTIMNKSKSQKPTKKSEDRIPVAPSGDDLSI